MNCAIHKNGRDEIERFVRDCVRQGNDFLGSNLKLYGVKPHAFAWKWTLDDVDMDAPVRPKVSELREAPSFRGRHVGSREDVNAVVCEEIRERYTLEKELQILRSAIVSGKAGEFTEHNRFAEELVEAGRAFKDAHFPKAGKEES